MSGKLVNLRTERKRRERAGRAEAAEENAMRHGEAKALRQLRDARAEKAARDLDGVKRDPDPG